MPYCPKMLDVESNGGILTVTLNRPEVRNAFNQELIAELSSVFTDIAPRTRVIVIQGAGETFCAGGDLNWMRRAAGYSEAENEADAYALADLFQRIVQCRAVVIAKVQGAAFGGGCGLVAAADVAIAAHGTKFSFSEVKLGLVPATISTIVIPKIGSGHARHLFATGEVFVSSHALRIGLIHDEVEIGILEEAVAKRVQSVLASGPTAVAMAKQLSITPPLGPREAAQLLARVRNGDEAREGIAAFLEKRKANFFEEQ